jgi:hypothetical protein
MVGHLFLVPILHESNRDKYIPHHFLVSTK